MTSTENQLPETMARPFVRRSATKFGLDLRVTPEEYWSFQEAAWPFVERAFNFAMSYDCGGVDPMPMFQVEVDDDRAGELYAELAAVVARINS